MKRLKKRPVRRGSVAAFVPAESAVRSDLQDFSSRVFGAVQGIDSVQDKFELAAAYTSALTAWACVQVRANAVSNLKIKLVSETDWELPVSPISDFLDNAVDLLWLLTASLSVFGCAYLLKTRNDFGYPVALNFLNPLDIQPVLDRTTVPERVLYYQLRDGRRIENEEVVAVVQRNPLSDVSATSAMSLSLYRSLAERNLGEWAKTFFKNSARPDGILSFDGVISSDQLAQQRDLWQQFKGATNAWRTFVAGSSQGGRWSWQPVTPPPTDLAMSDLARDVRFDICAAFQVNPILIGGSAADPLSATSTYDAAWRNHVTHVAIPTLKHILSVLNTTWLHVDFAALDYKLSLEIDFSTVYSEVLGSAERFNSAIQALNAGLITADEAREFVGRQPAALGLKVDPARVIAALQGGVITINEARAAIGYEPRPDGNQLFGAVVANNPSFFQPARTDSSAVALSALDDWQNAHAHNDLSAANDASLLLPLALSEWIKAQLAAYWNSDEVFRVARHALLSKTPPTSLGATKEQVDLFWLRLDSDQSDRYKKQVEQAFFEYLTVDESVIEALSALVTQTLPPDQLLVAIESVLASALDRTSLVTALVGDLRDPGALYSAALEGAKTADVQLREFVVETRADPVAFSVDWSLVSMQALTFAQNHVATLVGWVDQATANAIQRLIEAAIQNGWPINEFRNQLSAVLQQTNLVNSPTILERVEQIAETELARAYVQGALERYRVAGVSEAVWQTAQDERVCKICRPRHNRKAVIGTGWRSSSDFLTLTPPAHLRCRCFVLPVIAGITDQEGLV